MPYYRKIKRNLCFSDGEPMLAGSSTLIRTLKVAFFSLLALSVAIVTAIGVWLANPSSAYYKPIGTTVERAEDGRWLVIVTRELPRGDVTGRWSLTVWVRRGEASFVCSEPMGPSVEYRREKGPTISYELPRSVARCMNAAPPISLTWTRQMLAWGWLPLRPVETTITVSPEIVTSDDDA